MNRVTSNQLGKIINAQFEELQTQITQVILENEIQEILQEGELHDLVKDPEIQKLEKLLKNISTIDTIESLSIIQKTQPKLSDPSKPSDTAPHQVTGLLFNSTAEIITCNNNKSKPFFDYKATVGSVIAVMKKTIKVSGFEGGFKAVVSRKKRKGGVLAEGIDNREVAAKAPSDTTESESIDMEEECLVEETSVDYSENGAFAEGNPNQMPKGLCVKTKKMLGKPLSVIDYGTVNTDSNVLDNFFLLLPLLHIKLSVQVPVCKFFALDINLVAITGKFFQEKLSFIRKIFSNVNGFGGASTPSKFGGIIHVTFTSEKAMIAVRKLANNHSVVVNTDLRRPVNNHTNWAIVMKKIPVGTSVEAVHTAMSEFGLIKLIKMQLMGLWQKVIVKLEDQNQADLLASKWFIFIGKDVVRVARANVDKQTWDSRDEFRVLLYTLSVGTNAHNLWDFVGLVGGKTYVINHNPVSYTYACCATVCFGSESDLVSAMAATPVIKRIGLHWSCLFLALCSVCKLSGHISLSCVLDQVRLATIYTQKFVPISYPLAFNDKIWASVVGALLVHSSHGAGSLFGSNNVGKPLPSVTDNLKKHLVNIESGFISLTKQIGELAKRLDSLNQGEDIVMEVSLNKTISNETATATAIVEDSSASPHVAKLENMLEGLAASVLSLSAHFDELVLAGGVISQPPSQ
ncbi:hypothetical protein G9A89_023530 [Geosiphon pyriformis]|nr:hypothetical protein G9A89_023530 [Geosiphon pyriformis]